MDHWVQLLGHLPRPFPLALHEKSARRQAVQVHATQMLGRLHTQVYAQKHALPRCLCTTGPRAAQQEALRAWADASMPAALLRSAAAAPRPTSSRRANVRRAHSLTALMAHLLLSSQASAPLALSSSIARIERQCRRAPALDSAESSLCASWHASPKAPKTSDFTGSKVRSLASTGPVVSGNVPQKSLSTFRALSVYSLGRLSARRSTAAHRCCVMAMYVLVPL